uniref:EZH inhibitory protein n=1 Tax=Bos mutus grunniens TaxID=30521 RepID=A0A8B9YRP9_BOSMU
MATQSCLEKEQKPQQGEMPTGPNNEVASAPGDARGAENTSPGDLVPVVLTNPSLLGSSSCDMATTAILLTGEEPGESSVEGVQGRGGPNLQGGKSPHVELSCVVPQSGPGLQMAPALSGAAVGQAAGGIDQHFTQIASPGKGRGRKRLSREEAATAQNPPRRCLFPVAAVSPRSVSSPPSFPGSQPGSSASLNNHASQLVPALQSQANAPGPAPRNQAAGPGPQVRSGAAMQRPALQGSITPSGPVLRSQAARPGPALRSHTSGSGAADRGSAGFYRCAPDPALGRQASAPGPAQRGSRAPKPGPTGGGIPEAGPAFRRRSASAPGPDGRGSPTSVPGPARRGRSASAPGPNHCGSPALAPGPGPSPRLQSRSPTSGSSLRVWHAVRMRASSPSPPGRVFTFPREYAENSSVSSCSNSPGSSDQSCPPSPTNFSDGRSIPSSASFSGVGSIATSSPPGVRRMLLPELEALSPLSSEEPAEEGSPPPSPPSPVL